MSKAKRGRRKKRGTHKVHKPQNQVRVTTPESWFNVDKAFLILLTVVVAVPAMIAPYGRSGGYSPDLHIAAWLQVSVFLLFTLWLIRHIRREMPGIPRAPAILPLSLFIFWAVLSGFWAIATYEYMMDAIEWSTAWAGGLIILLAIRSTRDIGLIMSGISIVGAALAALGVGQYLFEVDIIEQVVAPAGTLANKNMFGEYLIMVLPVAAALMVWARKFWLSLLNAITAGVIAAVILYTESKSNLTGLTVVLTLSVALWAYGRARHGYKPFAEYGKKVALVAALVVGVAGANLDPDMFVKDQGPRTQLDLEARIAEAALQETQVESEEQRAEREERIKKQMIEERDKQLAYLKENQGKVPKPQRNPFLEENKLETIQDYLNYAAGWLERVLPERYSRSGLIRITIWVNSIPIFLESPWVGVGLGNWTNRYWVYQSWWRPDYKLWEGKYHANAHNDYIEIICELGIIGLVFFIWTIIAFLRMAWCIFSTRFDRNDSPLLAGPFLGVVGVSTCMVFSFPVKQPLTMFLIVAYIAFLSIHYSKLVYGRRNEPDRTSAPAGGTWEKRAVLKGVAAGALALLTSVAGWWQYRMYESELYYRQASATLKVRRFEEAEKYAREAYLLVPFRSTLLWVRASALMSIGRHQDAIPMFHEVLRYKPYSNSALHNLAVLYADQGQPSRAADVLSDLAELQRSLNMRELHGYYLYKAQRWEEALVRVNQLLGEYKIRVDLLERAIARKEAHPSAYSGRILEHADLVRKYTQVVERKKFLEEVLKEKDDSSEPPLSSRRGDQEKAPGG